MTATLDPIAAPLSSRRIARTENRTTPRPDSPLDSTSTEARCRSSFAISLDTFFAFMTLGDDRAIAATYASGRCVHRRARKQPRPHTRHGRRQ